MAATKIEWTEHTWNFLTGCDKVSPGCQHCYAETMANRLRAMGYTKYANGFELTFHKDHLKLPLKWKKSRLIFVNSMSDLFHRDVPLDIIQQSLEIMRTAHWHQFQILTKRSERLLQLNPNLDWPSNVWMGVSVENEEYLYRVGHLKQTGAIVKFLSFEPLLGPLPNLNLCQIDWVIVGGESGPRARPMNPDWVKEIRDQCVSANIPFFFKQWGGFNRKKAGRMLEGKLWDQLPSSLHNSSGIQAELDI